MRRAVAAGILLGPILVACSGDRSNFNDVAFTDTATPPVSEPMLPAECTPPLVEFIPSPADAPELELIGPAVVEHGLDSPYEDAGARIRASSENDLGVRIEVSGLDGVNVHAVGDYWIRYRLANADTTEEPASLPLAEAQRLVRVKDGLRFARQTARPFGSAPSPLGYFEHLPENYSRSEAENAAGFPLLVYNHGIGEAYDWVEQDNDVFGRSPERLERLLRRGLPALLAAGRWDDSLPFVVLSPQRCSLEINLEIEYLRAFVEYAVGTYRVDPARVSFIGFSAGSYVTWEYTLRHSEELAATVHLAGGDSELFTCPRAQPPTWAFHARDDLTVPLEEDRRTIEFINTCSPRERAKLTVLRRGEHLIDDAVLDGTAMTPSAFEPDSDPYDQNLYAWLLQYRRSER